MEAALTPYLPSIAALCERFGIAHLELFGSAARGDFDTASSDYDFLVELDAAASGSRAQRLIGFADAMEELLGRPVDLVNPRYIRNPYFLQSVNESRTVVYDRSDAQAAA